jgi:hypothetical protein
LSNLPVILIEVVLIFGGVLAFGIWQLRALKKQMKPKDRAAKAANGETGGNSKT